MVIAAPASAASLARSLGLVHVSGTISRDTIWSPKSASSYVISGNVDVRSGVTLTIKPGTVVKALGTGILEVQGTLRSLGTAASPVVFTSVNDSSVGGKATGTGTPQAGDWQGIDIEGAADIEHTAVNYADYAVDAATAGKLTVRSDAFAAPLGHAVLAHTSGPAPLIEDNAVTAIPAASYTGDPSECTYYVTASVLNFGLLGGNTAAGVDDLCFAVSGTAVSSTIPAGPLSWVLAGTAGGGPDSSSVLVPAGATLAISPGTVIKSQSLDGDAGILEVQGTLRSLGTAASPVVFTSVNDSSVGGKATGTGTPQAGDWQGIDIEGAADIEHTAVNYAAVGVRASTTGTINLSAVTVQYSLLAISALHGFLAFRGSFADNSADISACNWGSANCSVDAAYASWGDGTAGPFPPSGSLVCGAVTTNPWLPGDDKARAPGGGNCDGSPTPGDTLSSAETSFSISIAGEEIQCNDGFEDSCQAIHAALNCLSAAYTLAKQTAPFTIPDLGGDVSGAAYDWLASLEIRIISSAAAIRNYAADMAGAATTILDVAHAYNKCEPG